MGEIGAVWGYLPKVSILRIIYLSPFLNLLIDFSFSFGNLENLLALHFVFHLQMKSQNFSSSIIDYFSFLS